MKRLNTILFYIIIGLSLFGFLFNLYILRMKLGKKFSLLSFIYVQQIKSVLVKKYLLNLKNLVF